MVVPAKDAIPNVALYNLRDAAGLSQQDVADRLNELARRRGKRNNVTFSTVSRWERGIIERPDPLNRQLLGELFNVSIEELGYARPRPAGQGDEHPLRGQLDLLELPDTRGDHGLGARVATSQREWCAMRRALNGHRVQLTARAAQLYEQMVRLGTTGLLVHPEWLPPAPVDLGAVDLVRAATTPSPELTGTEEQTRTVRPLASEERRYSRYSHAIRALEAPRLFENRLGYRLLDLGWTTDGRGHMTYGDTTYFAMVDVCEALAHETASAHVSHVKDTPRVLQSSWRRVPFRKLVGDPFDLARRPVLPATDTLTIRKDRDEASFVLHRRDSARVALAGDMFHIMPAGVFQPSSILPAAQANDFDLWRNMMREYSEEFLGNPEHDGTGAPIDYGDVEPFRSLERARRAGAIRVYCLGVGLDALTLAGEILTVAVFDAEVYDDVFAAMIHINEEGVVVSTGNAQRRSYMIPFRGDAVTRMLTEEPMAPAAAACLDLAWQHRSLVLDG